MTFQWLNEPKKWSDSSSVITVHTDAKTDFWRKTRNGAERDNGHFYYQNLPGDESFNATVNVKGD
jgi:regulation of enolase protein 1 (concanavalin A-like superfamily)